MVRKFSAIFNIVSIIIFVSIVVIIFITSIFLIAYDFVFTQDINSIEIVRILSPALVASIVGLLVQSYIHHDKKRLDTIIHEDRKILDIAINSPLSNHIFEKRSEFYKEWLSAVESVRKTIKENNFISDESFIKNFENNLRKLYKEYGVYLSKKDGLEIKKVEDMYIKFLNKHLSTKSIVINNSIRGGDSQRCAKGELADYYLDKENISKPEKYDDLLRDIRKLIGTDQVIEMQFKILDEAGKRIKD